MSVISSDRDAFAAYRQAAGRSASDLCLVFGNGRWSQLNLPKPQDVLDASEETVQKVLSLRLSDVAQEPLLTVICDFNKSRSKALLATRKTEVPKKVEVVQFSAMGKYGWLSNFFSTLILDPVHHLVYPSVESGYVAFKARQADRSTEEIEDYAHTIDPKLVKQLGRELWDRETETDNCSAITEMERLVTLKFEQNPMLATWLKSTGDALLEENTGDPFWGNGFGTADPEVSNQLGKILMRVRATLS